MALSLRRDRPVILRTPGRSALAVGVSRALFAAMFAPLAIAPNAQAQTYGPGTVPPLTITTGTPEIVGNARITATEPRAALWRAFTPQAFRRGSLTHALARAAADGVIVTDEAMAMERTGARPKLVEGREDNLKVTTPADLALADYLLRQR